MKKCLLPIAFFVLCAWNAKAQGPFSAGGGFFFGTFLESIAIDVRGEYLFSERIEGSANVNFYFATGPSDARAGLTTINFDLHYLFDFNEFGLYPLLGMNLSVIKTKVFDTKTSTTQVGLNLGAGAYYNFSDRVAGFAEMKGVIFNASQFVIGVGAKYRI